ncbi:hypothetical protein GCM10022403_063210 [Streptomyces coacervatus]|uniref:Uncharacterized protein n=1 Tax=Streptomyces coacervatus TaxID=647381 RepID=A0ABP7ILP3_9ACTN
MFTCGQGPLDPAGGDRRSITRCTCYLADRGHFAEFNRVYREFFADCAPLPARTTVVAQLVREGVLVEVDAMAVVT